MHRVKLFSRYDTKEIVATKAHIEERFAGKVEFVETNPELVIVIGGDGAILAAVSEYASQGVVFLGINRGTVGFLASADKHHDYLNIIQDYLANKLKISERIGLKTEVLRGDEIIYSTNALNEVVISSPLSVVDLKIAIDDISYMRLSGTGVLVSTATGSTAYNLSAHGPILTPEVSGFVVTELLDHSVPTPSLVVGETQKITVKVGRFKRQGQLKLSSGYPADVVLDADGSSLFSLMQDDVICLSKSDLTVKFAEFGDYDFFARLHNKLRIKI